MWTMDYERKVAMVNRKILDSEVPYVELFGVDGMRRGRPGVDTDAYRLRVGRSLEPVETSVVGRTTALRLTGQATRRAVAVLKVLYWKEFVAIYEKEKAHLIAKTIEEQKLGAKGDGGNGS